jgi:protein-S-isoprenylcysteine O-methyltransferase Ste14
VRAGRVQLPPVDLVAPAKSPSDGDATDHVQAARYLAVAVAPAIVLGLLGVSQFVWILRNWTALVLDPSLLSLAVLTRSVLYGAFVFGAAIALMANCWPHSRDHRQGVVALSLIASFLMVGLNQVPVGPILWNSSTLVTECGVALTVIGAAIAVFAILSLGRNFAVVPEARVLVTRGVYRSVRHPIYLAESMMIVGALLGDAEVTALIGTLVVIGLQIYRIRVEEVLLRRAFPTSFEAFARRTTYRLIPLVW